MIEKQIKGDAPLSPYTGIPGWETEAEQGVLVAMAEFAASPGYDYGGESLIVEIGSENGMSASIWATFAKNAEIVCIEINPLANFMHNLEVKGLDANVMALFGNSATMDWKAEARKLKLRSPEMDLLFIDGDHSYHGALADLRNFAPYVAKGGYLLLHDCACETNKLPHQQHRDVSEALSIWLKEAGKELGFRCLFTVDSLMIFRRMA